MSKEKPVGKRLLETIAKCEASKRRPTQAVQRDARIMVLNGVCMAYHRDQFLSKIMIFAEYDVTPGEYSIFFRENKAAAEEVAEFLKSQHCLSSVNRGFKEGVNRKPVVTLTVETGGIAGPSGISYEDIKKIRERHRQERVIRAKKEGGPRKRKTKKRRGKRKK